ncbi:MAG: hypothetical protein FWC97_03305 [Treponema sp.]|nr:hypothetical protein [Treponema sp.]
MIHDENDGAGEKTESDQFFQKNVPTLKERFNNADKNSLIVIAAAIAMSMIMMRAGILPFLYMAPIGYAMFVVGSLWLVFAAVSVTNLIVSLLIHLAVQGNITGSNFGISILLTTLTFFLFTWIIDGYIRKLNIMDTDKTEDKLFLFFSKIKVRMAFRFILASFFGAFAFFVFLWNIFFNEIATAISAVFYSAPFYGMSQVITQESFLEMLRSVYLRGGAFFAMLFLLFLNSQVTLFMISFFPRFRYRYEKSASNIGFAAFFVPPKTILVFVCSVAAVYLFRMSGIEILEIAAWNVLVACVILLFASGFGIVMHLLQKRFPNFRLIVALGVVLTAITPIGPFAIIALVILGIIENWLPLRVPKKSRESVS